MNLVATDRPRHDLHWPLAVITPCANSKFIECRADARKKMGVPVEQPFPCQRLAEFLRRVQHHFNNAIDVSILVRCEPTDLQPKPPSEGRPDVFWVKHHAFNCARFDCFFRKNF